VEDELRERKADKWGKDIFIVPFVVAFDIATF
jgi:hypothetical protein